jgi:hypothetical protein
VTRRVPGRVENLQVAHSIALDQRPVPPGRPLADRYADLGIGLTDASLVVLAARVGSEDVATFDERHFRVVRPLAGAEAFRLLPLDAPA